MDLECKPNSFFLKTVQNKQEGALFMGGGGCREQRSRVIAEGGKATGRGAE